MTNHTTNHPILILGATGKTGRRVASRLGAAGHPIRAASRTSATRFDWDDRSTWAPALDGAAGVYLVPPEPGTDVAPFVDALDAAGVERTVLLSARAPGQSGDDHLAVVESTVKAVSSRWTILRPSWFAQNFDEGVFAADVAAGSLALPVGDGREPFIDAEDIAEVAVAALTAPGHESLTYELSGPDLLTFAEAVEIIAAASGRPVRFDSADPAAWAAEMRSHHVPDALVEVLGHLFAAIRDGANAHLSSGVEDALGRPPTSFADWARRSVAVDA